MAITYHGRYASCKIFTDRIEETALVQILDFIDNPASEGMKLRFMPDVHAGAGCVIGFTGTLTDKVVPNLIGVDIGCGVAAMKLPRSVKFDPAKFDCFIRENIPSGRGICSQKHNVPMEDYIRVALDTGQKSEYVQYSLGSLGGGNHFLEVNRDQFGDLWLVVHSGSRNFGLKIATFHQSKAKGTIKGLEWLEGEDASLYFDHMRIAQTFAQVNRILMLGQVCNFFQTSLMESQLIESVHNYIDFEDRIVRKGAISAKNGQNVIIPWNMRDGSVIGVGLGNNDWNCSAPHGAGRVMGRRQAMRDLKLEDFQKEMVGVWSSCVNESTVDEAPMAYKDHKVIFSQIKETVEVNLVLKPIYNFKAQG